MPSEGEAGKRSSRKKRFGIQNLRSILHLLLAEGLDPRRASAAVFIGIFIGIVPVYGFQSLIALALAAILRLNKPLTFGATFVNNPLLQPFLVWSSLEIGHYILKDEPWSVPAEGITMLTLKAQLGAWLLGSVVLGGILGGIAASAAFLFIYCRSSARSRARGRQLESMRFVKSLFRECPAFARGFVRWKIRLDKICRFLAMEDLGQGPVIDIGCGYGIALALAAFQQPGRALIGCDLDEERVKIARQALGPLGVSVSVNDARTFHLEEAGLILIIDVLQYLDPGEQKDLLRRCCAALMPGGRLVFRVHDRKRGMPSRLSSGLDRILFLASGVRRRPSMLHAEEYERVLEEAGMRVSIRRFINRLPLAHLLFLCEKPCAGSRPL